MPRDNNTYASSEVIVTIPFHDLDPMQIVWHGNYLKYFDQARFALFEKLGVDLFSYYQKTRYIFPITKTATKFIIPLKHRDKVVCRATLVEARIKIVIDFSITLLSHQTLCTTGRSEQVAVKMPEMELMLSIPDEISTKLEV